MLREYRLPMLVACLAAAAFTGFGQETTATITGIVTDDSGARVARVKVTATNVDTNVQRYASTTNDGAYSLLFVPIGRYTVEFNAPGFKKFEQTGLVLEVNRNAHVDPVLQIGAITQTIEVRAGATAVETGQPALGSTVNNQDIENLPLVNRDVYSLLNLTAGVDTTGQASDNFGAPMQVTLVNGSPNSSIGSVNYTLDGGSNTNGLRNTGNVAPNPDAVQEFRVITNSYPADQGRFGGGLVTMVTKSGTNSVHGTLFEFLRNNKLNANQWVPGVSALQKAPLHRNQFGGTAGGPIVRNKTFIFGSYSGLRERTSYFANTATPLTAQERNGDLSSTGGTAPVDPLSGTAFPGKIVPVTRIDPVAAKTLNTYLNFAPNLPNGLYEVSLSHPKDTNELIFKFDHNLNDSHRLTFSTFVSKGEDLTGLLGNLPWVQRDFVWNQYNYNFSETWIVSPSRINEFRASYVRNFGGRVNLPAVSLGDLGSKYVIQGAPSLPQISVTGRFNLTSGIPGPVAGSNQYQLRDVFSVVTARHSIRLGAEAVLEKMIHATLLNNYGVLSFTTTNPRGSKNATADFLLGLAATMNQDAPTYLNVNDWYYALFVQDDFKVSPRLTLNLGVRWDLQTPPTDPFDRFLTFIPNVQSKIVTGAPPGLVFPGDSGVARGIIAPQFKNISPRLGIAWDPFGDHKTAIRAAGGIFYGSISGNLWDLSSAQQPFGIRQAFNDVYSLADPYKLQPGGVGPFPYNYRPSAPRFVAPSAIQGIGLDYVSPYTYQMNAAVQRQLSSDTSFTVAYVGTLAHRIPVSPDLNYPVLNSTANTANVNARRPYLVNVLSTINVTKSILNSGYHGLQITGDKRMSRNFSVKGFYTFGKGLDFINTQSSQTQVATDWNNIALDRGRAVNDRRHSAVFSGIWNLNYFRHAHGIVRAVAGGWSLSAIASFRSGTPLTITAGSDRNFDGTNNDRADLIGDPYLSPNRPRSQVVSQWFNIAAFSSVTQQANSYDGTAGRGLVDSPGSKNADIGIFRAFRIKEGKTLQFRAESTNAFNLVNLSAPGTNAGSLSNFGRISTAAAMRQVQMGLKVVF